MPILEIAKMVFLFANDCKRDIIRIDKIVQKRISEFARHTGYR